jgi:hypothetical protein
MVQAADPGRMPLQGPLPNRGLQCFVAASGRFVRHKIGSQRADMRPAPCGRPWLLESYERKALRLNILYLWAGRGNPMRFCPIQRFLPGKTTTNPIIDGYFARMVLAIDKGLGLIFAIRVADGRVFKKFRWTHGGLVEGQFKWQKRPVNHQQKQKCSRRSQTTRE